MFVTTLPRPAGLLVAITSVSLLLLPLGVYYAFWLLVIPERASDELWHKPEWMFIALMLQVEATREALVFSHRNAKSIPESMLDANVVSNLLMVVLCSLVLFTVLGRYEKAFEASPRVDSAQWFFLVVSTLLCIRYKYRNLTFASHEFAAQAAEQRAEPRPNADA